MLSYIMKNGQDLTEYRGGSYAVHTVFPPNTAVGRDWSVAPGNVADLDLSLMQFIIDTNKDSLPQPSKVDGKSVLKFAVPSSTTGSLLTAKTGLVSNDDNIVTTFYLDAKHCTLLRLKGFTRMSE